MDLRTKHSAPCQPEREGKLTMEREPTVGLQVVVLNTVTVVLTRCKGAQGVKLKQESDRSL